MLKEIAFEADVEQFKGRIHFDSFDDDSQDEALEVLKTTRLKPVFGGFVTSDIRFISDFCAEIEGINQDPFFSEKKENHLTFFRNGVY